jgi:hypothetical protein
MDVFLVFRAAVSAFLVLHTAQQNLFLHLQPNSLFAWLISHQPAVLFSQNKPATSNQPAVLFSQNKPAPAISHQPTEQAASVKPQCCLFC